jgi:hypothetical protein
MLAISRRRMPRVQALLVVVAFAATGCRFQRIWSGLEAQPDGTLKLAAEEPLCGCLSVVNANIADVRLRAMQRDATVGEATLRPAERRRFRFDWGGGIGDHYEIAVSTLDGQPLQIDDALEVEERPRWVECEDASCEFGDLNMSTVGKEQ